MLNQVNIFVFDINNNLKNNNNNINYQKKKIDMILCSPRLNI